jgi:hypothetical protein
LPLDLGVVETTKLNSKPGVVETSKRHPDPGIVETSKWLPDPDVAETFKWPSDLAVVGAVTAEVTEGQWPKMSADMESVQHQLPNLNSSTFSCLLPTL